MQEWQVKIQIAAHLALCFTFIYALDLDYCSLASASVLSSAIVWVIYELLSLKKEELADAVFLPNAETF